MKQMSLRALLGAFTLSTFVATSAFAQDSIHLNRSIETLQKDEPIFGLFTGNFSLANARALSRSGLDYILIDMEHTPFNPQLLQEFLIGMSDKQAIAQQGNTQMATTPIVRLPANGRNDPECW